MMTYKWPKIKSTPAGVLWPNMQGIGHAAIVNYCKCPIQITSDQQHALPIIQSAIMEKLKRIEIGFKKTEREIEKFEAKYQISSEKFINEYTAEDMDGGDDEYISWMGEIHLRQAIFEELQLLRNINNNI